MITTAALVREIREIEGQIDGLIADAMSETVAVIRDEINAHVGTLSRLHRRLVDRLASTAAGRAAIDAERLADAA